MDIFGISITKKKQPIEKAVSFIPKVEDDGAIVVSSGAGAYGQYINMTGFNPKTEIDLINKYRKISMMPEVESAILDIVNEAIVENDNERPVEVAFDPALKMPVAVKNKITEQFNRVKRALNFDCDAAEIFHRWYVDGRLYYHDIYDEEFGNGKKVSEGIKEIRYIDPRKIMKVKETEEQLTRNGSKAVKTVDEYYIYTENESKTDGIKILKDSITYVHSGLFDPNRNLVLGHLNKSIKPQNQLNMLENAAVIYRISRAPERRIFYVDVGNLPKTKAESYLKGIMRQYKNKLTYNPETGETKDATDQQSMLEDFWLPRREGGKGTEVTTLPGGCFDMNTKIPLLDGRKLSLYECEKEFNDGKENWIYSCSPETGEIKPGKIGWAGVTQNSSQVMEIELDNGEKVICTPDHKFPIIGKGFVEAQNLKINESFIPFNTRNQQIKKKGKEYNQIYQNHSKKWEFVHRSVAKNINLEEFVFDVDTKKDTIHHKDFDRFNNNPENLVLMNNKDHFKYHSYLGFSKENQIKGTIAAKEKIQNMTEKEYNEFCEIISKNSKKYWNELTQEEYLIQCKKISKAQKIRINNFDSFEYEKMLTHLNNISEKGNKALNLKIKNIKDFQNKFRNSISNDKIILSKKRSLQNKKRFLDNDYKERVFKNQTIKFPRELLNFVSSSKNKTAREIVNEINNNEILNVFLEENKNTKCANWNNDCFRLTHLNKLVNFYGYDNWRHFKKDLNVYNHKIVSIKFLEKPIEVGTLTIDNEYHTFAISQGIFTKNSNLGEMEDVDYFKKKLYKSLNVPISRMDPENQFNMGRSQEITRDELKFHRFIQKLQKRFSLLFYDLLEKQLIYTKTLSKEKWKEIKPMISFQFAKNNHFYELKETELITDRLTIMRDIQDYIGTYYSADWVRKNILKQSDIDIKEIDKQIKREVEGGDIAEPDLDAERQARMGTVPEPEMDVPPSDGEGEAPPDDNPPQEEDNNFLAGSTKLKLATKR